MPRPRPQETVIEDTIGGVDRLIIEAGFSAWEHLSGARIVLIIGQERQRGGLVCVTPNTPDLPTVDSIVDILRSALDYLGA